MPFCHAYTASPDAAEGQPFLLPAVVCLGGSPWLQLSQLQGIMVWAGQRTIVFPSHKLPFTIPSPGHGGTGLSGSEV